MFRRILDLFRSPAHGKVCFSAFATTNTGLVRKENQDSFVCDARNAFLCVADGMGGGADGALASRWVCDAMDAAVKEAGPTVEAREAALVAALHAVNGRIRGYAREHGYKSMGSTVVGLAADPSDARMARVFHAGDSRAYRFRFGRLDLLTSDHTVGNELGSALAVGEAERGRAMQARSNPLTHILTRAVGTEAMVRPEWKTIDVQRGDRLLLCSDGVHDMLDDAAIAAVLSASSTPQAAAARIEAEVRRAGACDNYTIVCAYAGESKKGA